MSVIILDEFTIIRSFAEINLSGVDLDYVISYIEFLTVILLNKVK